MAGADFLVVGRPITKARGNDPASTANSIIDDIQKALDDLGCGKANNDVTHDQHKEEFDSLLKTVVGAQ